MSKSGFTVLITAKISPANEQEVVDQNNVDNFEELKINSLLCLYCVSF